MFQIENTKDGTHTILNTTLNTTYHSTHGAIQESMHIYIQNGLLNCPKQTISILEIGFGTGLNVLLTFHENQNKTIFYETLETNRLPLDIAFQLNYCQQNPKLDTLIFKKIHNTPWGKPISISETFTLLKQHESLLEFIPNHQYDLIYFDTFGPTAQPELWEKAQFEKLYSALNPNGILVTFCAKGSVKRCLKEIGYIVETLPGPPGKREMTRARKV